MTENSEMGDKKSSAKGMFPHLVLHWLVRPVWVFVKYALVTIGVFLLLGVIVILPNLPDGKRFRRYCSYPDKDALIAAETNDVTSVCDCSLSGTNYVVVVMKPCGFLASGPAVLVYGPDGRLFDKTGDEGEDSRFQQTWGWRKSLSTQTENWLKTTSFPKPMVHSPTTMGEFVEYLGQGRAAFTDCAARHSVLLQRQGGEEGLSTSLAAVGDANPGRTGTRISDFLVCADECLRADRLHLRHRGWHRLD